MPRKGLTKEWIFECANEVLTEKGIEGVTLATIAKKLDIRSPSLYNHITGLGEIKDHLSLTGMRELRNVLQNAVLNKQGDDAILAFSDAYIHFVEENPGLYEMTVSAPTADHLDLQLVSEEIVEIARTLLKDYQLDEQSIIHAVRGLRSILHGFIRIKEKSGFGLSVDLRESMEFILRTYLAGLKSENSTTSFDV